MTNSSIRKIGPFLVIGRFEEQKMFEQDIKDWQFFQYRPEMKVPVYVRVERETVDSRLINSLRTVGMVEVSVKDHEKMFQNLKLEPFARILSIQQAVPSVARKIESVLETDRYGLESVSGKEGYRVYRFKNACLTVFSFSSTEWKMGVMHDFGLNSDDMSFQSVINRFLGWALAPFGYIGIWGTPIDEGMVVMRQANSKGEACIIDTKNKTIITRNGVEKLNHKFKFIRLDSILKNRQLRMSQEELMGFLSQSCTYLDYEGTSVPVRQMLQYLAKTSEGVVHPEDSFRPRTDLSLS